MSSIRSCSIFSGVFPSRSLFALLSYTLYSLLVICCLFYLDIIITNIIDGQVDTLLVYTPSLILKLLNLDINGSNSTSDMYIKFAFLVSMLISCVKLLFSIITGRKIQESGIPTFLFVGVLTSLMLISIVTIFFTSAMHSPIERISHEILFWGIGLIVFTFYRNLKIVSSKVDEIIKNHEQSGL